MLYIFNIILEVLFKSMQSSALAHRHQCGLAEQNFRAQGVGPEAPKESQKMVLLLIPSLLCAFTAVHVLAAGDSGLGREGKLCP